MIPVKLFLKANLDFIDIYDYFIEQLENVVTDEYIRELQRGIFFWKHCS
jgi:plasmid stabilization system protein ParE